MEKKKKMQCRISAYDVVDDNPNTINRLKHNYFIIANIALSQDIKAYAFVVVPP